LKILSLLFFSLSLLTFIACDSGIVVDEQPHEVADAPRPINTEDVWHHVENVNISASYENNTSTPKLSLDIKFLESVSTDVKHFQIYIDTDNNASTGFSGGADHYEIIGADIMIEEGRLFKSTSTSAWTWELKTCCKPTYIEQTAADGSRHVKSTFKTTQLFPDINVLEHLNISIEPVNEQWQDTNNFVLTQAVPII